MLVSHGVPLDPARWQGDDRFTGSVQIKRSVLGIDIGELTFREPDRYDRESHCQLGMTFIK